MSTDPREWDASSYAKLPMPHVGWGQRTLARLPLDGDETVLELGCGTGRDTEALLAALPSGRVIALDGSDSMVEHTRQRCGGSDGTAGGRLTILQADLRQPLDLPDASVDAVFSVATLHWVPDHPAVFAELARVLRPGGRMALDYGGPGNVAEVSAALLELGRDYAEVRFPGAEQESAALSAAGFAGFDVHVRREPPFVPGEHLDEYLRTVCLGRQLNGLEGPEADALVAAVAMRLPGGAINYVRTEVDARR
ncbi:MAG TPA: class I SAM-dependent methyltransferase [Frankiaceae bacterium]|nr:class I SAM-dependent methyltransferase [Frankiaceae bacterium]